MKTIKIELAGVKYKIPATLNDIDYATGLKLYDVMERNYKTESTRVRELLGLLTGVEDIKATDLELESISTIIQSILSSGYGVLFRVLKLNGKYYGLRDIDKITVEEYVVLESLLNSGKNAVEIGNEVVGLLYFEIPKKFIYRLRKVKVGKAKAVVSIGKGFYKTQQDKPISDYAGMLSTELVLNALKYVIDYRDTLVNKYEVLYPKAKVAPVKDANSGRRKVKGKYARVNKVTTVAQDYGLYDTLYTVCDNSQVNVDAWLVKTIEEFFTFLEYKIQKDKEEMRKLKQERNGK